MQDTVEAPKAQIDLSTEGNLLLGDLPPGLLVQCDYTNWRGEDRARVLSPQMFWFGATKYHPEPSLLLRAVDAPCGEVRDFRVKDFDPLTILPGADLVEGGTESEEVWKSLIQLALFMRRAQTETVSKGDILGAAARAYCAPGNTEKVFDPELCEAFAWEVQKLFGVGA